MKYILLQLLISLVVLTSCTAKKKNEKPNIVFMLADDCTNWDIACYGSPNAITPNIDQLANEGMRFNRCYQAASMCSPTRHNIFTGVFPAVSGAYPNHTFAEEGTKSIVHYLEPLGYRIGFSGKRHIAPKSVFPFEYLGETKDPEFGLVEEFLQDVKRKNDPFALMLCWNQPHTPWDKGDTTLFNDNELVLPPNMADTKEVRNAYKRYLAEVNYLDNGVGQAMELLKKYGFDENTIVIFAGEHGYSFPFAKWTCYEAGLKSAFIAKFSGAIKGGTECNALIDYSDILPTMVDLAGGNTPDGLEGKSLVPLFAKPKGKIKEYSYSMQTTNGVSNGAKHYPVRSIVNEKYRYILNFSNEKEFLCPINNANPLPAYSQSWIELGKTNEKVQELWNKFKFRPSEELYDVDNDPWCMQNLADIPELQQVKNQLKSELLHHMSVVNDEPNRLEEEAVRLHVVPEKREKKLKNKRKKSKM